MIHPMRGPNRLKLGIFSANADGGLALTRVPERWPALWPEIVEVAQMADRAGIEFFLPIARWKGFGGEMNSREWSFETLTYAAALAGVDRAHRAVLDRACADGASGVRGQGAGHGRSRQPTGAPGSTSSAAGTREEFALFGLPMIEDRYAQGLEWFEILTRIYAGGRAVRFRGQFYRPARRLRASRGRCSGRGRSR